MDVDTASISRNVVVDVPVVADARTALEKLSEWAEPKKTTAWIARIEEWNKENPLEMRRDKGLSPQMIMEGINEHFKGAIIATDVGQHQMWATQYLEMERGGTFITSGGLGTMGFGFPAAVGAKSAVRKRGYLYHRRWWIPDEYAGNGNCSMPGCTGNCLHFK